MANTKSAAKRARQTERITLQNRRALTAIKNHLKKFRAEVEAKQADNAKVAAQTLSSSLDKAVKTGRVHRNYASRHKRNMTKSLATLSA